MNLWSRDRLTIPHERAVIFAVLGAICGIVGALLSEFLPNPDRLLGAFKDIPGAVFFVPGTAIAFPGIVFGLSFAALFWYGGVMRRGGAALFAAASAVGNCMAISMALYLHDLRTGIIPGQVYSGQQVLPDWACCAIAGIEGGLLLGAVAMALLRGTFRGAVSLAAVGMVLGTPFGLMGDFTPAFALWQAGYALVLSLCLPATLSWARAGALIPVEK